MGHTYATLDELKRFLGDTVAALGTDGDEDLLRKLEGASASIDEHCQRTDGRFTMSGFGPRIGTNRYDNPDDEELDLDDDLLSATTVAVTQSWGGSPVTFVENTDFWCEPADRTPYRELELVPYVRTGWMSIERGISVTGKWGFQDSRVAITTLAAAVTTTTATTISLTAAAASPGMTLLVDSEQMYVASVATTTATVRRGVNGTTAATHLISATVERYLYPSLVVDACLALAQARRKGRDAGLMGNYGGVGPAPATSSRYAERALLREMLWPYTLVHV